MRNTANVITIKDLYKDKTITFSSSTDVKFRELTDEEINWEVTAMNKDFAQLEKELAEMIFEFSEEARSNHTDETIL